MCFVYGILLTTYIVRWILFSTDRTREIATNFENSVFSTQVHVTSVSITLQLFISFFSKAISLQFGTMPNTRDSQRECDDEPRPVDEESQLPLWLYMVSPITKFTLIIFVT